MRIANLFEQLTAPGILAYSVPVEALYDREAAKRVIFRRDYASLDDVRAEGQAEGLRRAIAAVLASRGIAPGDDLRTALADASDLAKLESALRQAVPDSTVDEILAALRA